jgi:hypothetical protein
VRLVVSTDTLELGSGIGFDVRHVRDIVLRIDRESMRAQRRSAARHAASRSRSRFTSRSAAYPSATFGWSRLAFTVTAPRG